MKNIIRPLILVLISSVILCSFAYAAKVKEDIINIGLSGMVQTMWTAYGNSMGSWEGDVDVYVMTPRGNYFATSNPKALHSSADHFRGASTTKMFTAAAIMKLYQDKKLNIDDKITAMIPGTSEPYVPNTTDYDIPNKDKISIRLLMCHRAGVWDVSNSSIPATAEVPYAGQFYSMYKEKLNPSHTFTFDELAGVVALNKLSYFPPDAGYHYSDTGYSILGKIIERVSGKSYAEFITDTFLKPNGLKDTYFPYLGSDIQLKEPYIAGYSYADGKMYLTTEDNMSPHVAEGNVMPTLRDLGKWMRSLMRGEAGVDPSHVAMMIKGVDAKTYGLGLSYVPGLGYGHDGGHAGYATVAKYDPTQDVTVIIAAGAISFDDLKGYYGYLHDMGRAAKNVLGYSTAEVQD